MRQASGKRTPAALWRLIEKREERMFFQFDYFLRMFTIIFSGFKDTVSMAFVPLVFAVLLGFVLAASRYCNIPALKRFSVELASLFRSAPRVRKFVGSVA